MCGKMVFGCAISSLSAGYGLLFAFLQHDISKKCVPRFFVSRNFSDVRECMKRLPVFRNREAYCHEYGNNFLEKGMPWKYYKCLIARKITRKLTVFVSCCFSGI